jgi:hypothetical protein
VPPQRQGVPQMRCLRRLAASSPGMSGEFTLIDAHDEPGSIIMSPV